MKFKIEVTVDFEEDKFKIPANKSLSMINALQREQVEKAVCDALFIYEPQIHNVYKQRNNE